MNTQPELFKSNQNTSSQNDSPVVCLGIEFENDSARRDYFTELLREKLKDPEFRSIEGFPLGEDEDILNLSDPPYYTACPNPWIADFINEWESKKPEKPEGYEYHREPFATDVSEGKNDPIYNAHSYHTKVPHKAVMRFILHYTEPGDIVFDGFCGTGMIGVAAQMCGSKEVVESLGYRVDQCGKILKKEKDEHGKEHWQPFSSIGARKTILSDLSPAATFIAHNYNTNVDISNLEEKFNLILSELRTKNGWMWQTVHTDGVTKGDINYVVWSEVYSCPECSVELDYFSNAFEIKNNGTTSFTPEFNCPGCNVLCAKSPSKKSSAYKLERVLNTEFDSILKKVINVQKRIPVAINYSMNKKRYYKLIEESDLDIIKRCEDFLIESNVPNFRMPEGDESRRNDSEGITHAHLFYSKRILTSLSIIKDLIRNDHQLNFILGSMLPKLTILNRYMPQHGSRALVGPMTNTLYVPPVNVENNLIDQFEFQGKKILKALNSLKGSAISTQAAQSLTIAENSLDYIFIDPPFGANIMYSELSSIREAWLGVQTNNEPEAIENKTQNKSINVYRQLM